MELIERIIPMMVWRNVLGGLLLSMAALTASGNELDAKVADIKKDLFYLAGEECEGRGVETQGIIKAGDYIASRFKEAGLRPGGPNGSYFQPFKIGGPPQLGKPNSAILTTPDGKTTELVFQKEFLPTSMAGTGKVSADLVFVGYGLSTKKPEYDDYKDVNVEGKFVIILRKVPQAGKKDNPFEANGGVLGALGSKLETALAKKAAGVIFVSHYSDEPAGDPLMPFGYGGGAASKIPVLHIKRKTLAQWLDACGQKLSDIEKDIDDKLQPKSLPLNGFKLTSEVTIDRNGIPARNVIGVCEGSGPLAEETIVIGAHYDHLGKGEPGSLGGPASRGKIHYGADDNASGTTCLLELARRFGAQKNRSGRRLVFIAFSGEERGLLGSIHYCKEPTFPLDKTVMMLNMDMVGRVVRMLPRPTTPAEQEAQEKKLSPHMALIGNSGAAAAFARDRLVIYGTGTADCFENDVTEINKSFDFYLLRVPGGSGPSDHDSFYRKRIPVLFFFTGIHAQYHRPTDLPELINLTGIRRVADISEVLLSTYSSREQKPKFQTTRGGFEDPTEERPARPARSGPKLGIMPGNYESQEGGVLVEGPTPGGAAEKAGIKPDDVILEIAGKPIKNIEGYMSVMATLKAGTEVEIRVKRKDKILTLKITPLP